MWQKGGQMIINILIPTLTNVYYFIKINNTPAVWWEFLQRIKLYIFLVLQTYISTIPYTF